MIENHRINVKHYLFIVMWFLYHYKRSGNVFVFFTTKNKHSSFRIKGQYFSSANSIWFNLNKGVILTHWVKLPVFLCKEQTTIEIWNHWHILHLVLRSDNPAVWYTDKQHGIWQISNVNNNIKTSTTTIILVCTLQGDGSLRQCFPNVEKSILELLPLISTIIVGFYIFVQH